eukprot:11560949-Heterocapsa_arctica.AAC.1
MDFLEAVTKTERGKRDRDILKSTMETRTTTMDHIMVASELGNICRNCDTLEDFNINKKKVCGVSAKCLMCKGLNDMQELDTVYSEGQTT